MEISLSSFENYTHYSSTQHSVLSPATRNKVPLKKLYPRAIKHLAKIAKISPNPPYGGRGYPAHLKEIIKTTSDAEEQYALLVHYYNCLGLEVKKTRSYRPLTEDEKFRILSYYSSGYSVSKIAEALGRHVSTIYYFIKRYKAGKI
ncbi:MAG TPA: hypothetical protein ENF45_04325 [Bacteroidetes bacterium]|nr:hypothetical protein [Bacteroidota bacterium]